MKKQQNKELIFAKSPDIKEKEFKEFMKVKAKKSKEENISCKHIGYDTVIIGTKEYIFEILKDKKWGTEMYYLKGIKNLQLQHSHFH